MNTLAKSDRDYLDARIRNLGRILCRAIDAGDVYAVEGVRYALDAMHEELLAIPGR